VRQILVNLLANAVKFTPAGGRVTISAGSTQQAPPDAQLGGPGPWVYLRVEDNGAGIPADKLPAIFVVEDNGYAEATSSSWSVAGTQVKRGEAFGMPAVQVDGSDFFAVYEAAREATKTSDVVRVQRTPNAPRPSAPSVTSSGRAAWEPPAPARTSRRRTSPRSSAAASARSAATPSRRS